MMETIGASIVASPPPTTYEDGLRVDDLLPKLEAFRAVFRVSIRYGSGALGAMLVSTENSHGWDILHTHPGRPIVVLPGVGPSGDYTFVTVEAAPAPPSASEGSVMQIRVKEVGGVRESSVPLRRIFRPGPSTTASQAATQAQLSEALRHSSIAQRQRGALVIDGRAAAESRNSADAAASRLLKKEVATDKLNSGLEDSRQAMKSKRTEFEELTSTVRAKLEAEFLEHKEKWKQAFDVKIGEAAKENKALEEKLAATMTSVDTQRKGRQRAEQKLLQLSNEGGSGLHEPPELSRMRRGEKGAPFSGDVPDHKTFWAVCYRRQP
jgi:hypothetical protein